MSDLASKIESVLFVSTRPLSVKRLAEVLDSDSKKVETALDDLGKRYKERGGGMMLVRAGKEYQMMSSGENAKIVQEFIREEFTGELTRPSLETLTIIAYRGPVTKPEIEQIRGVNCSLILRNLMIRGLVEAEEDKKLLATRYRISMDFMRYLNIRDISELPDYERLRSDKHLQELLEKKAETPPTAS